MVFKNLSEACAPLSNYASLNGVINENNNKRIDTVFVGIIEEDVSQNIYSGIRGIFPSHTFNAVDLEMIEYWVGYQDGSIELLSDVLKDDYLRRLAQPLSMEHPISVTPEWSVPIRIPKGLHVRMKNYKEGKFEIRITDNSTPPESKIFPMERSDDGRINLLYGDLQIPLQNMIEPEISVRMEGMRGESQDFLILFVPQVDRNIP